MKTSTPDPLNILGQKFTQFAEKECKATSNLYYRLSKQIAGDSELLHLCEDVREGQPVANAYLAAVHFLVLKNKEVSLAQFYPSVTGQKTDEIPFDIFRSFVLHHRHEINYLLKHRIVQTNVITRCNYLLPVFSGILAEANNNATIIDVGCSAGLNLNFDQYEYYHDGEKVFGNSAVKLHCEIKSQKVQHVPPIKVRLNKIGIDQNLINYNDPDDLRWLKALIWPDQTERFEMMQEALRSPRLAEIKLIRGSSIEDFKKVIDGIDMAETLIIAATHVLYQFPEKPLKEFYRMLDTTGRTRDLHFLSAEATDAVKAKHNIKNTAVVLTSYKNHQKNERLIAETNGHGNWIRWL